MTALPSEYSKTKTNFVIKSCRNAPVNVVDLKNVLKVIV